jgi:parvulin-like peptidyl-prolyl isomerase
MRAYYDAHKTDFHVDKDQRKVDYIFINQDAVGKTLQISDDELKKDFDPEKFLESVHVSQIMLKILTPKDSDTVQQQAASLVARARGKVAKPEDFGALARGNSQDAATKDKDGDLGVVKREDIKPGSYLQRALTMKIGDISDPIKDGNSYYVIKVTDRKLKSFEEAKETLLASSRNRLSYKRASDLADDAAQQLATKKDIKAVADDIAKKMNLKQEDVLRHTPFFTEGDDVPDVGTNPTFEEAVANLKKPGDVGVKVGIRSGFAVPQLVAMQGPHDAPFDEVKSKVEEKCKLDKAKDLAAEKARTVLAAANATPDGLKAAAEKDGLKTDKREGFHEGMALENFGSLSQIMNAALPLKEGQIVKEPVSGNDKYLVFGVTKRTDPDMTKYNEQSKAIEQRLLDERRQLMFDSYMDGLKKKMKQDGKITIYKDTINQIFAKESAPAQESED